ncbi:MAG: DUF4012 domain-containing protein [Actinomycetia bacterium]|nr:DUF4012 domain-containing protein [Actinomycetes bacterium]
MKSPGLTRRNVLIWIAAGLVVYSAAAALTLRQAAALAQDSRRTLEHTAGSPALDLLDDPDLAERTRDASHDLEKSHGLLDSLILRPIRIVPVAGRQLSSARALSGSAADLALAASLGFAELNRIRSAEGVDGPERVEQLEQIRVVLQDLQGTVDDLDAGPGNGLVQSLSDARAQFLVEQAELSTELHRAHVITTGMIDFLKGPNTYLVFGANNAEMRAGSGAYLSFATLEIESGNLSLSGFEASRESFPVPGVEIPDKDAAARWSFVPINEDWRRVNYSPRFDEVSGPLAKALHEATYGTSIDGVMAVDPIMLQAILEVVGELEIGGSRIGPDDVLAELFVDQYRGVDSDEENTLRTGKLEQVASRVVAALGESNWDPVDLIEALEPAAAGRHLLAWSPRPKQGAMWDELELTGHYSPTTLSVNLMSSNGSKLDPFLDLDVAMEAEILGDSARRVTLEVQIENQTPELPSDLRYLLGPYKGLDRPPGSYSGRVVFNLPGISSNQGVVDRVVEVHGPDGNSVAVSTVVYLERGESVTILAEFDLPLSVQEIVVESSARVPAVQWQSGDLTWTDARRRTVVFGSAMAGLLGLVD